MPFVAQLYAQQLPNVSFESWSSALAPDAWGTWGGAISALPSLGRLVTRDTMPGNRTNGKSSMKLIVDTMTLPAQGFSTISGFASLGGASYHQSSQLNGIQFGYYRYAVRPDSLFFDYKYLPAAGYTDSALISVLLSRFDTATKTRKYLLNFTQVIDSSSQWRTRVIPLIPLYDQTVVGAPDSLQIILYSSYSAAHAGTTLWIDSLHFDASVVPVTGISDMSIKQGVMAYPNPADAELHILTQPAQQGAELSVYDMSGREIYKAGVEKQTTTIDTHTWAQGSYLIQLLSADQLTRYRGRVQIVK